MQFSQVVATFEALASKGDQAEPEKEIEAQEKATEVADSAEEVAETVDQIDKMDEAVDKGLAASDQLTELQNVAEESVSEDTQGEGLTKTQAAVIQITHESIMSNLGFTLQRVAYTNESFQSASGARVATMEAIDKITSSLSSVYTGIVNIIKTAYNMTVNFLVGLTKNRALMERHLKNLLAKVKALTDIDKPKTGDLGPGTIGTRLAEAISIGEEASYSTAMKILTTAENATKVSSELATMVNELNNENAPKDRAVFIDKVKAAVTKLGDKRTVGGKEVYGHFTKSLSLTVDENGVVSSVDVPKKASSAKVLTKAEMLALLEKAQQVLFSLKETEKTQSKLKDFFNRFIARLSELGSQVKAQISPSATKEVNEKLHEAKKTVRLGKNLMSKAGAALPNAVYMAVKAAADYVTNSLISYRNSSSEKTSENQSEQKMLTS